MARTRLISITVTEAEHTFFHRVAQADKVSLSALVRNLVRARARALHIPDTATPQAKRDGRDVGRQPPRLWIETQRWVMVQHRRTKPGALICTTRDIRDRFGVSPVTAGVYLRNCATILTDTEIAQTPPNGRGQAPLGLYRADAS